MRSFATIATGVAVCLVLAGSAAHGKPAGPATDTIEYFGGTVFSSAEVVSVLWGPDVAKRTVHGMPDFFAALVNSTYMDQLTIYDTKHIKAVNGHKGSHQTISRGKFYGQVEITPKNHGTTITEADIHKELKYQISQGNLPPQGPNMFYVIFFPPGVTIDAFGYQSCRDFVQYHYATSTHETKSNVFYGVIPDCGETFDNSTINVSANLADAVTDNLESRGANPEFPQAWEDPTGFEIGDLCDGIPAILSTKNTNYYVQEVYLDSIGSCGTGNFKSP